MKTVELNGTPRPDFGKKATKSVRQAGFVPCVLYGGEKNIHFQVKDEELRAILYTPDVKMAQLNIAGNVYKAVVQEVQFHPVKDTTMHVDFLEVSENKPVVVSLPVRLKGLAAGVRAGGKLSLDLRKLKIKGLYTNIPAAIEIDVTDLGLGKTMQVGDLHFENLEVMNSKKNLVCSVKMTRAAANAEAEK